MAHHVRELVVSAWVVGCWGLGVWGLKREGGDFWFGAIFCFLMGLAAFRVL